MMKLIASWVLCLTLTAFAAGCASAPGSSTVPTNTSLSIPDTTSAVQSANFQIAPLDVLDVRVFGVEALSGELQVDPDGNIDMPLLGVLAVRGNTTFALARTIEQKLAERYLQNPQVQVRIKEAFGQQVTVDGAVSKPGIYKFQGGMTLLQAVATAGGPSETAELQRVVIFRTIEGKRQGAAFDLNKIRRGEATDPVVFGNDIVVVDGSAAQAYRSALQAIPLLGTFFMLF